MPSDTVRSAGLPAWPWSPARPAQTQTRMVDSMQARLSVLAAASILPLLFLFVGVAYLDYRTARMREGNHELDVVHSIAVTVERELHDATLNLQSLALSSKLENGDMAGFRGRAVRFVSTMPKGSAVLLLDRSGRHILSTLDAPEEAAPGLAAEVARQTVARVFATGQPVISNLAPQAPGGALIVTADMPVRIGGRIAYDLSLVLPAVRFSEILQQQKLAPGLVVAVLDASFRVVARVPNPGGFVGRSAHPSLLAALSARGEGVAETVSLDGTTLMSAFVHTQPSGWSVALGVPEADLRASLLQSLRLAIGAGGLGLLFSLATGYAMAQRVLRPMRALTRYATEPAAPAASFGLLELDEVAAALRDSARRRQEAMDQLQAANVQLESLNGQLEARVLQETASRLEAERRLAQAQRLEALGQLAGGIAHDFNNVLQAIDGGLSLIHRRAADPDAVRRLSRMAAEAAARGASVTGRLLTFARRRELAGEVIDPGPLLRSMREILAHTLAADIEVRVDAPAGLPCLLADKAQLETVLINLAINARDAMPQGGVVMLSATAEAVPPTSPHPLGLAAGAYVRLRIVDDGSGMSPDVLSRASEPFFTTKAPGKGTGLGLAMARGFAQQSRGAFALESARGLGTSVTLWFPQAECPAQDAPPPDAPEPAKTQLQVLMVDDDGMVREMLAGELEASGFYVTTAADGAAALALIDAGQAADLLITDYSMPGMNGLALIGQVRRRRPGLPALLLTGYVEPGVEAELATLQDRLTVMLHKPIGASELARRAAGFGRWAGT